ncbi:hypothetical protein B0T26DRAFT_724786 [Lasiosphaeria miniovina]|uniref:Transmembrane protein n=1 Tax=Lasiosphaeria miniovina TaxID=1954250 RepID=A0AA39ZY98_9PEZI|nr:uncharacterized protein B0T26DRAFT_724786 [Lasiosphaeria miniovina]KAK0705868.1 hypothetical protein B0T26DRAFT_724786 [Lasiosphaeria miniovina]
MDFSLFLACFWALLLVPLSFCTLAATLNQLITNSVAEFFTSGYATFIVPWLIFEAVVGWFLSAKIRAGIQRHRLRDSHNAASSSLPRENRVHAALLVLVTSVALLGLFFFSVGLFMATGMGLTDSDPPAVAWWLALAVWVVFGMVVAMVLWVWLSAVRGLVWPSPRRRRHEMRDVVETCGGCDGEGKGGLMPA